MLDKDKNPRNSDVTWVYSITFRTFQRLVIVHRRPVIVGHNVNSRAKRHSNFLTPKEVMYAFFPLCVTNCLVNSRMTDEKG